VAGRDTPPPPLAIERVDPALTHPLRHRVLRAGQPASAVNTASDDNPDAAAFAARTGDGTVVGTVIVAPEPCPFLPDRRGAWRLRGMATEEAWRSRGVGTRLLAAALDHLREQGAALVWCNARTPARAFYERAGFRVHGEEWVDPLIGPHVAMARPL
jgi:GNAT superfamily N-acetyltransferase